MSNNLTVLKLLTSGVQEPKPQAQWFILAELNHKVVLFLDSSEHYSSDNSLDKELQDHLLMGSHL